MALPETATDGIGTSNGLEPHIGERVRVDLRPKECGCDGAIRRIEFEELDEVTQERRQGYPEQFEGVLRAVDVSDGQCYDVDLSKHGCEEEVIVHENPVFTEQGQNGGPEIRIGEEGFSRVEGGDGVLHVVETADISLAD